MIPHGAAAVQNLRQRNLGSGRHQGQRRLSSQRGRRQFLNRRSEPERQFFRCGRYFTVGHEWYAATREGRDIGPCATRHQAQLALAYHLAGRFFEILGQMGQVAAHFEREATELEVLIQEFMNCQQHALLRSENGAYVWARQRLEKFEGHSAQHDHSNIRATALRHYMSELDG